MSYPFALTLMSDPSTAILSEDVLSRVIRALEALGVRVASHRWLHSYAACDLGLALEERGESALADVQRVARETLVDLPVDIALLRDVLRRKRLLISDMDSTLIEQECIDELADFAGLRAEISEMTARAMRGELDFAEALHARVALLKGLEESVLNEVWEKKITLMPGAKEMAAGLKKEGVRQVLVSGGFTFFTSRVAEALGFDEHFANRLEVENGKLTGKVALPILDKEVKRQTLIVEADILGISMEETMAMGDGANDLPMIQAAGLGVAFHAKPSVAAAAPVSITHSDMRAALWLMGLQTQ